MPVYHDHNLRSNQNDDSLIDLNQDELVNPFQQQQQAYGSIPTSTIIIQTPASTSILATETTSTQSSSSGNAAGSITSSRSANSYRTEYIQARFEEIWQQAQQTGEFMSAHDRISELFRLNDVERNQPQIAFTEPPSQIQPIQFSCANQHYTSPSYTSHVMSQSNIDAISFKMQPPQMNKDCLDLWFVQLEHWFKNNNIRADLTKFNTLVGLLEHTQMTHVLGTVMNPPEKDKYDTLKSVMLSTLADSQQQRYQKLINAGELGDQKPSFRLNELRRLAGGEMSDLLLKQIWLNQLPSEIRAVLAVCQDIDLNRLAKKADDIMEGFSSKRVAIVTQQKLKEEEPAYICELRRAVEQLQGELKTIRSRSKTPSNSRRSSSNGKKESSKSSNDVCWYHRKFGDKSRKCQRPCKLAEEFAKQSQTDSKN